jgi:hypothetical protein
MGIANLKELLRDERLWCVAARVEIHPGEASHWSVNEEGDVIVSVITVNFEVPINANLDSLAGGSDGSGVWHIPDPGTEVMVCFDGGDFEGEAHIVSRTSGGKAPAGIGPGIVFVLGAHIELRSPGGTAKRVAYLDELDDLRKYVRDQFSAAAGHTHVVPGAAVTTTIVAAGAGAGAGSAPTVPPSIPTGTTVAKLE